MNAKSFDSGSFKISTELLHSPADVRRAVAGWSGDGWVCYASDIVWRRSGRVEALNGVPPGLPLSGEWLDGPGADGLTSVHLRQTADGWSLTRIEELPGDDRIVEESFLSSVPDGKQPDGQPVKMRYRTIWQKVAHAPAPGDAAGAPDTFPIPVWTPVFSRFSGWK